MQAFIQDRFIPTGDMPTISRAQTAHDPIQVGQSGKEHCEPVARPEPCRDKPGERRQDFFVVADPKRVVERIGWVVGGTRHFIQHAVRDVTGRGSDGPASGRRQMDFIHQLINEHAGNKMGG
jgi:hypothetical protein